MTVHRIRILTLGAGLIVLTACASPTTAATGTIAPPGEDLGPSTRAPLYKVSIAARPAVPSAAEPNARTVRDDAQTVGTVNSADAAWHTVNIAHEPIPSIGWPAMTMDFPVAPGVDLSAVKPGARVTFSLEKGKNGKYEVRSIQPAAKGRQ